MPDDRNEKPVALVTGAAGGLGGPISCALAAQGFDLILTDLSVNDDLDRLFGMTRKIGARTAALAQDISRVEELDAFVQRANEAFGRIDCLVNNAGVSVLSRGDILDVSVESFDRCLGVNLRGTFFLTQRVARSMLARGNPQDASPLRKSIITLSTVAVDHVLGKDLAEYCIAKSGLVNMTRHMAVRLVEHGIDCYDVRPGMMSTTMTRKSSAKYQALIEAGFVPAHRWGELEEVGTTVANLARGVLRYAVGQTISLDGGMAFKAF